ncbi:MAG: cytochrome c [Trueperaceae bacterium]|nr:cytochrome c [Trueperaceae bacterium]
MSTRTWLAVACISLTSTIASAEHENDALVERGREAYVEHYCGACHRLDAVGSAGIFGPPHDDAGRVAQERAEDPATVGRWPDARAYIRESIEMPSAYLVPEYAGYRHAMPAYDLSDDILEALVEFLMAQHAVAE